MRDPIAELNKYNYVELSHNDHLSGYCDVKQELLERERRGSLKHSSWISPEEEQKAIDTNELWEIRTRNIEDGTYKIIMASSIISLLGGEIEFPPHKISLYLEKNQHLINCSTVAEWIEMDPNNSDDDYWGFLEDKAVAIEKNELWSLTWFPDTPVGSHHILASSIEVLMKWIQWYNTPSSA